MWQMLIEVLLPFALSSIYHFDCWNPLNGFDHFISRHLNHLFNEAVLQFFATGDYREIMRIHSKAGLASRGV
jgi:hypothetical protein